MVCLFKKLCQKRIKTVTVSDLKKELQETKGLLLDVRTKEEYQGGHIQGARNIPLDQIENYQGSKEQPIYVICQSGMRSKHAARALQKKGYTAVNVKGGMSAYSGKVRGGK